MAENVRGCGGGKSGNNDCKRHMTCEDEDDFCFFFFEETKNQCVPESVQLLEPHARKCVRV